MVGCCLIGIEFQSCESEYFKNMMFNTVHIVNSTVGYIKNSLREYSIFYGVFITVKNSNNINENSY